MLYLNISVISKYFVTIMSDHLPFAVSFCCKRDIWFFLYKNEIAEVFSVRLMDAFDRRKYK
jgi:hypothetical protein